MPKDKSEAGVRVSWTTNPQLTLKLLTLIKKEKIYRQVFFPRSSTLPKDRHLYARAAVTEFFRKDEWMRDAERRGLAIWDATERAWRPTKAWGSTISNPIDARITLLKNWMSSGYYKTKYQIADQWTSFDDIPSKSKRATFRASHPYYFLLKELCERGKKKGRADALEYRDMPKPNPGNSKRRKRSPSISSSSSSSTSDSDSDSESDSSTRSSSSSSSIDTKPPQAEKLRTSDTNTSLVPGTEVKPIIVTPPHQSLVSAQTPRRAPRSVEEVLMSLPRPAKISAKHEKVVLTDSDSESVEFLASTSSGSSSVVLLSEKPPSTWSPKEAKRNATPESVLGDSDGDEGSTVSNSEASCASGGKEDSREIDESHQRGLEDGSDMTLYKEYDDEKVLDAAQLARLAPLVLLRRFKHSNRSLNPGWYTAAVVDWMSNNDSREKYVRYRATLEMGLELINRWSKQSQV
ncbi:hypothetical protein I302_101303 [Kwoniella bestiolae CBS 10118]|uniref:Uncharacterized protein n=1 Tax=Kwoniella bestiolae CBS 10118 TaxID=1296100 RepID=A0A1B9G7I3_9TREE|nr:hypothetical protein I302_04677 [Kwoniella bestiolae CBS 10118]OCF26985.1 hypothetical protein I302_04677 [Kwoniella bestiolae CBS 10118]